MQSTLSMQNRLHVAVLMDGNGRWATARGLSRRAGHVAGASAIRPMVEAAPSLGIGTLTLYAFSADNWNREPAEVAALMELMARSIRNEVRHFKSHGIRLSFIGRRDRISSEFARLLDDAERATAHGDKLQVRIAIDYSARHAIAEATARVLATSEKRTLLPDHVRAQIARDLGPDVDLIIRTGREQRISDFLLWECAYAEFVFLKCFWPEFTPQHLSECVTEYRRRDRRFGKAADPFAHVDFDEADILRQVAAA
jgi:undecaprenyl diphosphate synthase